MTTQSSNDNSARNSVVLNIINPLNGGEMVSPRTVSPQNMERRMTRVFDDDEIEEEIEEEVKVKKYASPAFNDVEKEFKDQLLAFTTDLLLNDFDMLKNVAERGNKVIFHVKQLKQLIAILYLQPDDRARWDTLIEIETEKIVSNSCCFKDCVNPFYEKIKNIFVQNKINFMTTPFAVNMSSTFRISLDLCLTEMGK